MSPPLIRCNRFTHIPHFYSLRAIIYAICFELNAIALAAKAPSLSWYQAHDQITQFLTSFGFEKSYVGLYFGNAQCTPVTCVLALQACAQQFDWFCKDTLVHARMLRIEETCDLTIALP